MIKSVLCVHNSSETKLSKDGFPFHEQQNQFNQVQEQQHQFSHIHEQQHHVKHIPEQQVNHFQQQPHHAQEQLHHQHHHQKMRIPQPSRPLHTDHTPVVTTHLKIDPLTSFRVTEDQTAHKPGEPSYFAPDPDPSIKPPKVPPTNDPFSFPSNGQLPLDLIVQQHNEKQAEQLQHLSSPEHSSTMTAQDLFNIFNTINSQQQQQLEVIPPSAVDQHLHNHDLYESEIGDQHQEIQHEPQNFHPQYETFNYDERTQQGAYGSDSYPVGSSNYEHKRAVEKHTSYSAKPGQVMSPVRANQNSIHLTIAKSNKPQKVAMSSGDLVDNQVDYDDNSQDEKEIVTTKNHPVYTTLPSRETAQSLAHLAASGMKKNINYNQGEGTAAEGEEEEGDEEEGEEEPEEGQKEDVGQNNRGAMMEHAQQQQYVNKKEEQKSVSTSSSSSNEGNVQVQKSVQIYESSYFDKPNLSQHKSSVKQEHHQQEYEDEYAQDEDMEDGDASQATANDSNSKTHPLSQSMSFGERLTPKRN
ncbi:hypothetical protein LSTR_LSTR014428 [Laodelphax striatellus]|uniref:Uncharacterized protein n=1 Tax=Laodelphax striatellus TaxID=195883 RepID=A0A482XM89_LAOST|nr:hypothetical protein LSTR_LSTR014428 [Laodelphax striatellus]